MNANDSFLTVSNIRNLLQIFERFLSDRYSLEYDPGKLDIKKLIYTTMITVSSKYKDSRMSVMQLNKITLSEVKNVTKDTLQLDKSFNGTLTRDRDVLDKSVIINNMVNRPIQSTSDDNKLNMMKDFDLLVKDRYIEKKPVVPQSIDGSSVHAIPKDDFIQTFETLKNERKPIHTNAYTNDPKDFFASKPVHDIPNTEPDAYLLNTIHTENNLAFGLVEKKEIDATANLGVVTQPVKDNASELRTAYIVIDSRNRNTTLYPNPCDYVIDFDNILKNIKSVELTYALYDAV
jgi:hypothetical protein